MLSEPLLAEKPWLINRNGHFNIWVATLKAADSGEASLDYLVRDYPDTRNLICELLDALSQSMQTLISKGIYF